VRRHKYPRYAVLSHNDRTVIVFRRRIQDARSVALEQQQTKGGVYFVARIVEYAEGALSKN
jgi:hypothetical protein